MDRTRPPLILVTAILNLVFGSLGILLSCCGGFGLLLLENLRLPAAGTGAASEPLPNIMTIIEKHVPGYQAVLYSGMASNLVLAVVLVVGSIGLLRLRSWGRWMCLTFCIVMILAQITGTVYNFVYVNPKMPECQREYQQKMEAWQRRVTGNRPGPQIQPANPFQDMASNPTLTMISSLIAPVLVTGYSVYLLVVMLLPGVRAAFAGTPRRDLDEPEDYHDLPEPAP